MANKTAAIIDTAQSEVDREDYLFMAECYDALEEAKQNERMLKMELKNARVKLAVLRDNGARCDDDYDAAQELIVRLDLSLSQVWAKYDRLMYGQ